MDPAKAYPWTHWVAFHKDPQTREIWVLDTVICSTQWIEKTLWKEEIENFIQKEGYKGWHFTHWLHLEKSKV